MNKSWKKKKKKFDSIDEENVIGVDLRGLEKITRINNKR